MSCPNLRGVLQERGFRLLLLLLLIIAGIYPHPALSNQRCPPLVLHPDTLRRIDEDIRANRYGVITSLLIYQGHHLVHERYYGMAHPTTLKPISSVTKSLTSLALGVCMDSGWIASLDTPIATFFPEYREVFEADPRKRLITLRHLLAQTSGLLWDEWTVHYSYVANPLVELSQWPGRWVDRLLRLPLDTLPGTKFNYNSGHSEIIKEIICRATGWPFKAFVMEFIFRPLRIESYLWEADPTNGEPAWGGLALTSRDMAKLGLLLLNQGRWGHQQVLSPEWIAQSTQPLIDTPRGYYGLHWWIDYAPCGTRLIFAAGYGDQYVFVAPDRGLVIAINGRNFASHRWDRVAMHLVHSVLRALPVPSN